MGIPASMIIMQPFEPDARHMAQRLGMPGLGFVILPEAQVLSLNEQRIRSLLTEAVPAVLHNLTHEPTSRRTAEEKEQDRLSFTGKDYKDALDKMNETFMANRWGDGLPLIPPTPEAVEAMLAATDLAPDYVLGKVEPGKGDATVKKIAVNAVMAGCKPEYFPIVLAAVEAIIDPRFDLYGVQTTTGPPTPVIVVSGPLARKIGMNSGFSSLGPGNWANATIGRALRLVMINIGHAWPGDPDMKPIAWPGKYTAAFAENEDALPAGWKPLRVMLGYDEGDTIVGVLPAAGARCFVDYGDLSEIRAQMMGGYNGRNHRFWGEEVMVVLSPALAQLYASYGLTPEDLQKTLFEIGRVTRKEFGPREGLQPDIPNWIVKAPDDAMIPIVEKPEDIIIVVSGGVSTNVSLYLDNWGFGKSHFVVKKVEHIKH